MCSVPWTPASCLCSYYPAAIILFLYATAQVSDKLISHVTHCHAPWWMHLVRCLSSWHAERCDFGVFGSTGNWDAVTPTGCQFVLSLQVHMYDKSEMYHITQLLQYLQLSLFDQFDDHFPFFVTYLFLLIIQPIQHCLETNVSWID